MNEDKKDRLLELFFRAMRGEYLSVTKLAGEYGVSGKSISRDIRDLKLFLADHRDLLDNAELRYDYQQKSYQLVMDEFLSSSELLALTEVLIGARAFSKMELLVLVEKLKHHTVVHDRTRLESLIRKEMYHYSEVKHICESVQENLWILALCIDEKKEITVEYYKMDGTYVEHRLRPASILFTDYYFYLIAFKTEKSDHQPYYFRVDRIKRITKHRDLPAHTVYPNFDEGLLRKRSLLMWPGKLRTIQFVFTGPSVQAVLDKLPTAKIIERHPGGKYLIEAEVYGDGIKMWLLSQGSWVKVLAPEEFVESMKKEIEEMKRLYE